MNHAWSETSHDIAYKNKPREGFGNKALEQIKTRLNRIMDKYLLPAGYKFQRVQHDYERLQQGKELFDNDILRTLEAAKDNNERYELLTSLKEHVLPNYDDLSAIYKDLIEPLISAVKGARDTPTKPITTPFGDLDGKTAGDIACLVVEIFEMLRYLDIDGTFNAFCEIFRSEADERTQNQILEAVRHLASFDLAVWEQVGPGVQIALVGTVERLTSEEKNAFRPLVVAVWQALVNPEISGTSWKADSVTLSSGALTPSPDIVAIREKAISGLFEMLQLAVSDQQRRTVLSALRQATRTPLQPECPNELRGLILSDAIRIAKFLRDQMDSLSYELKEEIEEDYLFDYHRAREIVQDDTDRFGCQDIARSLIESIIQFRDRINGDQEFGRYKTLVGFKAVFAEHWDEEDQDFQKTEEFRFSEAERFVDEIVPSNEEAWFEFIEKCAATNSTDGATFPIFIKFLTLLSKNKPETTKRFLAQASSNALQFLTSFLDGLFLSGAEDIYQEHVERYLKDGAHLYELVRHWRVSKLGRPHVIKAVLDKAIAADDSITVNECVLFAIEGSDIDGVPSKDIFLLPALNYLSAGKDARWAQFAWSVSPAFFDCLTGEEANVFLENLLEATKINHQIERILFHVARKHLPLVLNYLGQRLKKKKVKQEGRHWYEAIPYQFRELRDELSKNPKTAIATVRHWYDQDSTLFRFLGGRLLSAVFPTFQTDFSCELCGLITNGTGTDAAFVLAVTENYHGEVATHDVLKCIVAKYPEDQTKLNGVRISLDGTGTVWGEFGMVDALRKKKAAIEPWLCDAQPEVRTFAARHIQHLDLMIADEQRRAEEEKAFRELQYDEDDDKKNDED